MDTPVPVNGVHSVAFTKAPLRERLFYGFCRTITVGFSRIYFPGPVLHRERLPKSGPYIVAPVHRSYVDWLLTARISKRRLRYVVKAEVWKVKAAGKLMEMLGAMAIHRGAPDREAVHRALEALATGEPLVMFPEGTRRFGPVVEDLQEGAAYVAMRAGVPIVPIGIGGAEKSMARGKKFPRPVWTRVVIGEPIYLNALTVEGSGRVPRSAIRTGTQELVNGLQNAFDESLRNRKADK